MRVAAAIFRATTRLRTHVSLARDVLAYAGVEVDERSDALAYAGVGITESPRRSR